MSKLGMTKSFKYRIYPNPAQVQALELHLREAADLYNAAIQERRDAWKTCHKNIGLYDQISQLKMLRAQGLVGIANYQCARDVLQRVDRAFAAFFRRAKAGLIPGYPRYRSFRRFDSITFPTLGNGWNITGDRLRLQGIGLVKLRLHRPTEGRLRMVTVKREVGRWFAGIVCDQIEQQHNANLGFAVGIDLGIANLAVFSDGTEIDNHHSFVSTQTQLRKAQRRCARRKRGSNGRNKARELVALHHWRIANRRADFNHKLSRYLVNHYGLIAVEDLNVKGLAASMLAKHVNDAGWAGFLQKLTYKAENAGCVLVKVNPAGTSQQCSSCGQTVKKALSERRHVCSCGLNISRDHNAAINILRAGIALAAPTWNTSSCVAAEARAV